MTSAISNMKSWIAPLACAALLGAGGAYLRYTRPLPTQQRLSQPFLLQVYPQPSREPALLPFCGTLLRKYGTNFNTISLQDIMMTANTSLKLNALQYNVSVALFADKSIKFVLEAGINQETRMCFIDKEADSTLDEVAELRLADVQSLPDGSSRSYTTLSLTVTPEYQTAYRSHLAKVLRAPLPLSPRAAYESASR